jgi:predicted GIY-YIG superfamily endonuclease
MWYVYVLRSIRSPFIYIGQTRDLEKRIVQHNDGLNQSTKHYIPFVLEAYVAVRTEAQAIHLEKYFKTGSGRAVLNRRILMIDGK